jgi:hypothetical protein
MDEFGFNYKAQINANSYGGTWSGGIDHPRPWDEATDPATNYTIANIGQAKLLFSWDMAGFSVTDTDGDGLPDAWEIRYGLNPTDPSDAADSDVDGDGMSDVWEIKYGMGGENSDVNDNGMPDSFEDFDGDGISNEEEAAFGLNPYSTDSDGDGMTDDYELANDFDPSDPADGLEDVDLDGSSNASEAASGQAPDPSVEPIPGRKVNLRYKIDREYWDATKQEWKENAPSTGWATSPWIGPGSAINATLENMQELAHFFPSNDRMKGQYYFENVGSAGPTKVRWIEYETTYNNTTTIGTLTKLTNHEEMVTTTSAVHDQPYPASGRYAGIFYFYVGSTTPESGFDNFERYSPLTSPNRLDPPWLMVPKGGSNEVFINFFPDVLDAPYTVATTSSSIQVNPAQLGGQSSTSGNIEVSGSVAGDDAYVTIQGTEAPSEANKIKVIRTAVLSKIEVSVQPYKINCTYSFMPGIQKKPDAKLGGNFPTEKELEDRLNEVYEKQMNIHFTVKPYKEHDVNYDIGPPANPPPPNPPGPYAPYANNMRGDQGVPNNSKLDIGDDFIELSPEESAVYASEYHSTDNVSLYFVGTLMRQHTTQDGRVKFYDGLYGYTRPATHRAVIALPNDKELLLHTIAHEVGHMNIGLKGKGLFHPRVKGGGLNNASNAQPNFPLQRLADDKKRLMYPEPTEKVGDPLRYPELLIFDEWERFRGE